MAVAFKLLPSGLTMLGRFSRVYVKDKETGSGLASSSSLFDALSSVLICSLYVSQMSREPWYPDIQSPSSYVELSGLISGGAGRILPITL